MALNLGFTPQYRPNEQLFVSCGRQNPSGAASTIRQLNDRIPVFYDNGAQSGIPEKMANSCAVLFFADSALFGGEDADMCRELEVAQTLEKNCICVWCEDMSSFDVRKLSDSMYALWLGLKNMKSVNVYDKTSVDEAVEAVISASGISAIPVSQDSDFPDITAGDAGLDYGGGSFNYLGTDLFDSTPAQTEPNFNTVPVRVISQTAVQAQQKRNSSRAVTVIIIALLILASVFVLMFIMKGKPIDIKNLFGGPDTAEGTDDVSSEVKPEYVSEITSPDQVSVNDEVKFGSFEGSEIEWVILDKNGDNLLLLSKNVLVEKPFDDKYAQGITDKQWEKIDEEHMTRTELSKNPHNYIEQYKYGVNWQNSSLRQWLNNDFINSAFTVDEQNKINGTYIFTPDITVEPLDDSVNTLQNYKINCGQDTIDKVFLLSAEECNAYFPTLSDRITDKNWWLRSNGYGFGRFESLDDGVETNVDRIDDQVMQIVDQSGKPYIVEGSRNESNGTYYYCYVGAFIYSPLGVRPSVWVNVGE